MLYDKMFKTGSVDALPESEKTNALKNETMFTNMVDALRNPVLMPVESISNLMKLFWHLVGQKITPAAQVEGIPSLSFFVEIENGKHVAMVMLPPHWLEHVAKNVHEQMGAIVYCASQAKDYYNAKIFDKEAVLTRAACYEAELMNYFKTHAKDWHKTPYQEDLMKRFPNGLADLKEEYRYEDNRATY